MKNNMENLQVIIKEAGLQVFKGSDLLRDKNGIEENTNFINVKTKETVEFTRGHFTNEEGWTCYEIDISEDYFISAREFLLTTFSNKELTNELFRRVSNNIVTELEELDELDEVVLGGYKYEC